MGEGALDLPIEAAPHVIGVHWTLNRFLRISKEAGQMGIPLEAFRLALSVALEVTRYESRDLNDPVYYAQFRRELRRVMDLPAVED